MTDVNQTTESQIADTTEMTDEITQASGLIKEGTEDASKPAEAAPVAPAPEVKPAAPAPAPAPAPVKQVAPAAKPTVPPVSMGVQDTSKFGAIGQRVVSIIETYIVEMAPRKPVTDQKAAIQQKHLYDALTKAINDSENDFTNLIKWVLAKFDEHKDGVFHDIRVYRQMENIALSAEDRQGFLRLVNLFKIMANPQGRRLAAKQVDFAASLQYGVTEVGRNRLANFFNR